jgi:serine/threonine-protein kinase
VSDLTGRLPRPGDRLGRFTVLGTLGEGGMGVVYRARSDEGQIVALKVVRNEYAGDATFRRRFAREARAASRVSHPNVVALIAVGEDRGLPYIAQRFVDGVTLEERIREAGRLSLLESLRICFDVASAIDALHAAAFVHRDLKPANILLDLEGVAHVTDFGLAKDARGSVLTRPGQAVGSMDYISPEQIRGEELTGRADVYALGCVLSECLSGSPPFADRDGMRVLWAHLQDDPPDPVAGRDDVHPRVGDAVLTALAKEPAKRPRTASSYVRMVQIAGGITSLRPTGSG